MGGQLSSTARMSCRVSTLIASMRRSWLAWRAASAAPWSSGNVWSSTRTTSKSISITLVMGQNKSTDLVLSSLVRARFCELLGVKVKHGKADLFLMGMLSLMDAILEVPIGMLIDELALDAELKAQLLSGKSGAKTPLSPLYDLMVAREMGNWEAVTTLGKQLNLSLYAISQTYNEAMRWAHQITNVKAAGQE